MTSQPPPSSQLPHTINTTPISIPTPSSSGSTTPGHADPINESVGNTAVPSNAEEGTGGSKVVPIFKLIDDSSSLDNAVEEDETQRLPVNVEEGGKVPAPAPSPSPSPSGLLDTSTITSTSFQRSSRSVSPFTIPSGVRQPFLFSSTEGGGGGRFESPHSSEIGTTTTDNPSPSVEDLGEYDFSPTLSSTSNPSTTHSRTHSFNRSGKPVPTGLSGLLKRVRSEREAIQQAEIERSVQGFEGEKKESALDTRSEESPIPPSSFSLDRRSAPSTPSDMSGRDEMARKERSHRPSGSASGGLSAPRHQLNALSPLQNFSPLTAPSTSPNPRGGQLGLNIGNLSGSQGPASAGGMQASTSMPMSLNRAASFGSASMTARQHQRTPSASEAGGEGRRSRASSVTSKLSRRDSLIARGEGGRDLKSGDGSEQGGLALSGLASPYLGGRGEDVRTPSGGQPGGLISRLMLVKAPNRNKENQEDEEDGLKRRTKSSNSPVPLSPLSVTSSSAISGGGEMQRPSTGRPRNPRSFSLVDAYGPASPGGVGSSPARRLSFLFGNSGPNPSGSTSNPLNIHEGPKPLSPEQVVSLAESLRSPILAPDDEDRPPSLSRSSSYRRRGTSAFGGRPPLDSGHEQEQLELEPVEYVEMQDDVLLPFVDRPTEVAELFENPYNKELLDIIRPTFATTSSADPDNPTSWRQIPPSAWTWDEFLLHLRENRADCDDLAWVRKLRIAVRARSEAMWEKIGACLGCDSDLLKVGDVPDTLSSPGPLGDVFDTDDEISTPHERGWMDSSFVFPNDNVGFEGDDEGRDQVCIEPIFPVTKSEDGESEDGRSLLESSEAGASFSEDFSGRSVSPAPCAEGAMETIGEEGSGPSTGRPTPSQVAGGRGEMVDPLLDEFSPAKPHRALPDAPPSPASARSDVSPHRLRAKSFVGLQIKTMPSLPTPSGHHQSSSFFPSQIADHPHFERGPGSPLFPTSFSALSLAPTLPNNNPDLKRSRMSFSGFGGALGGTGGGAPRNVRATLATGGLQTGGMTRPWMEDLKRKKSVGGMSRASDSALTTFESDAGDDIARA